MYHLAAACHPGQQEGHRCPLEAGHPGQLLLSGTPVRGEQVHSQCCCDAGCPCHEQHPAPGSHPPSGYGHNSGWLRCSGVPQLRGSHGCNPHPICAPEHRATHFINRKGYFSVMLQALMDHHGRFTDIYGRWSGRAHDAHVLRNSSLHRRMELGTFFPQRECTVGDIHMPLCVVGDAAYPLMPWLMQPCTGWMDPGWAHFNDHLNQACNKVECAFGRLKVHFSCLLIRLKMGEQNIPEVVAACCVLHNIVEWKGKAFLPAWMAAEGRAFEQPCIATIRQAHHDGVRIREALKDMFSQAPQ